MGIFQKIKNELVETDEQMVERHMHLDTYAAILGVPEYMMGALNEKANLQDGLTTQRLNDYQIAIEVAAAKSEMRAEGHDCTGFKIDSAQAMDWYLKKKLAFSQEREAVKAQYDAILNQIAAKQNSLEFLFEKQAEEYSLARYKITGKKTEIYPHGTVAIVTRQPSLSVGDESALQEWLGNLEPLSKAKFEVFPKTYTRNLDAIKEAVEKGSKVPGIHKNEGGDTVYFRAPKEGK